MFRKSFLYLTILACLASAAVPAFPPGSQASSRGEAKDSALLSSRDAGLLEPPELTTVVK